MTPTSTTSRKESEQGEGTYTYECNKLNCAHCYLMNRVNVDWIMPKPVEILSAFANKHNTKRWNGCDKIIIISLNDSGIERLVKAFPNRTLNSVNNQLRKVRQQFKIIPHRFMNKVSA
jgi:hypothetical protein